MGCRIHTLSLRGIALSAPRSKSVPVGREPNVTLIAHIQGQLAEWLPGRVDHHMEHDRKLTVYSETRPRRSTLGAASLRLFVTAQTRKVRRETKMASTLRHPLRTGVMTCLPVP
jgi:hypothetical protein